ncbi:MAG: VOC family protein [Candidatus Rifleibacteriota bacterium]
MIKNISPLSGSLHHLEIYVSNLQKSTAFWSWFLCEKLGYQLFQSWEEGRSYILGETYIVLVQAESRFLDIPFHRCRPGLNHLAFKAESKLQIDQITEELEKKGCTILYKDRHPYAGGDGYYAVFFEDPERIKVELVF